MPTAAWAGFIHSWHTLGIVLKWMCITVVGIPFAIATCLLIGIAALLFGALCLAAATAVLTGVGYSLWWLWWLIMRVPWWIHDRRMRRIERDLVYTLPVTEDRSRARRWFGYRQRRQVVPETVMLEIGEPFAVTLPPSLRLAPLEEEAAGPIGVLPGMVECLVCMESKLPEDFPTRAPTSDCSHEATDCCKACLAQCIEVSFSSNIWDDIKCPSCHQQLEHKDVAEFATPEVFQRYDTLSTRQAIEATIPNFYWCVGATCASGQEYEDDPKEPPALTCYSCGLIQCSQHQVEWHEGMTCKEYDIQVAAGTAVANQKSEKILKKITKKCPGCRRFINKNGGCPHMTCICGSQWCWNCGHAYPGHRWTCTKRR